MKLIYLGISVLFICMVNIFSVSEPRNPETEVTGAPGELTCQKSGCHSGGNFKGVVSISGIPDTVEANKKYTITLLHKSNAVVSGFELTSLDPLNKKCGILTAGSGTSVATGKTFGRQYIRQSISKLLVNGEISWQFTWQAPASITGDSVAFYFASLCGDNTGNSTKDNAITGVKKAFFRNVVSNNEVEKFNLQLFPNPTNQFITISDDKDYPIECSIYSVGGQLISTINTKTNTKINLEPLQIGSYSLFIKSKTNSVVKNFIKN